MTHNQLKLQQLKEHIIEYQRHLKSSDYLLQPIAVYKPLFFARQSCDTMKLQCEDILPIVWYRKLMESKLVDGIRE